MEGSTLNTVKDTEAVAKAKAEHAVLFANIAAAHQVIMQLRPHSSIESLIFQLFLANV